MVQEVESFEKLRGSMAMYRTE